MKREDFQKGQTVFIRERSLYRNSIEKIIETKVKSVGRKYVTVEYMDTRFRVEDKFREDTIYTPRLYLYLSREDIEREKARSELEHSVTSAFFRNFELVSRMSTEDLQMILSIVNKYTGRVRDGICDHK